MCSFIDRRKKCPHTKLVPSDLTVLACCPCALVERMQQRYTHHNSKADPNKTP